MKPIRYFAVVVSAAVLGACTMGPDYSRPAVELPAQHRFASAGEAQSIADLAWWQLFRDPALVTLIEIALRENLDVHTAAARVREAHTQVGSAYAPALPSASVGTQSNAAARNPGESNRTNIITGLFLSWELDLWGRYARATEAARANLLASEEARNAVIASLVASVALRYLELQALRETRAITERNIGLQRDSLRLTELLARQGIQTDADLRQAQSQVATTESRLPGLDRQIAQSEHALNVLLGRGPAAIETSAGSHALALAPGVPAGVPAQLLERRPDLRQAEQQLVAANANVGVARAQFFPRITLTGTFGRLSTALSDVLQGGSADVRSPGINALQTLFAGGAIKANHEASLARLEQAVLAYRKSIVVALQETADGLVAYDRYGSEIDANEERARLARESLRLADLRYRGGVASYFEVLDTQRQLLSAETDLVNSRLNRNVSAVQLYKSLGGGWQEPDGAKQAMLAPGTAAD